MTVNSLPQCPINSGFATVHQILLDGKHLIAGLFRLAGDTDTLQIARFMPDGALDTTFNYHLQCLLTWDSDPPYVGINGLLPFGQDRMIITGGFNSVNGQLRGGTAMLDTFGHLVDDYFMGAECGFWNDGFQDHAYLWKIVPAPDGSFYIHGSYHGYNDGTTNYVGQRMVSRLYGLDVGVSERGEQWPIKAFPNPVSGSFRLEGLAPGEQPQMVLFDGLGQPVATWARVSGSSDFDLGAFVPGLYTLRVARKDQAFAFIKLIVQ